MLLFSPNIRAQFEGEGVHAGINKHGVTHAKVSLPLVPLRRSGRQSFLDRKRRPAGGARFRTNRFRIGSKWSAQETEMPLLPLLTFPHFGACIPKLGLRAFVCPLVETSCCMLESAEGEGREPAFGREGCRGLVRDTEPPRIFEEPRKARLLIPPPPPPGPLYPASVPSQTSGSLLFISSGAGRHFVSVPSEPRWSFFLRFQTEGEEVWALDLASHALPTVDPPRHTTAAAMLPHYGHR
ncbi:hypothetical protein HPB51_021809 [Rhipicephalus microplus]|uniref:Uncharacterized protein n=1 Tax=Rhipicephalus microplus TaxID=6941 RepID=A0A9J6DJJ7_RHIMP|nr:hypothetical protein HPB51_021809 [Rhipicephalus microplus]